MAVQGFSLEFFLSSIWGSFADSICSTAELWLFDFTVCMHKVQLHVPSYILDRSDPIIAFQFSLLLISVFSYEVIPYLLPVAAL